MELNNIIDQLSGSYLSSKESINGQTIIDVYPKNRDGSANLDSGARLKNNPSSSEWTVFHVQRDQECKLAQFSDEKAALFALYVLLKGRFEERGGNEEVKRELRKIENDFLKAREILESNVEPYYFSLNQQKAGAVNLEEVNSRYNVFYLTLQDDKVDITKGRSLGGALVAIYNYGRMLENFESLKDQTASKLSPMEEETLKRVYLGK
ncbi:hypothetical protein V7266_30110 [Neobacillus drentensis]|uniref:hypothetical protein n=1 Tax=Neobacillus drentensis TaxID=220684 RepID=UPI002FFF80F5